MMASIPIIDLSSVNIAKSLSELDNTVITSVGEQIVSALTQVGFLQVINHALPHKVISNAQEKSKEFFELPLQQKLKLLREYPSTQGYHPLPEVAAACDGFISEQFEGGKPPDAKETLHYAEYFEERKVPEPFLPNFNNAMNVLMKNEHELHRRLMLLIGYGLHLNDPHIFLEGLQHLGTAKNETVIRLANYPPLDNIAENQERCGVHTDFGTLTFIFQNSVPGLQVKNRDGDYMPVTLEPGAILVNVGDLLQRWTGNILRSAQHKVVVDEESRKHGRTSFIYFGITDVGYGVTAVTGDQNEHLLKPIDGRDFILMRYEDIFKKGKGVRDSME